MKVFSLIITLAAVTPASAAVKECNVDTMLPKFRAQVLAAVDAEMKSKNMPWERGSLVVEKVKELEKEYFLLDVHFRTRSGSELGLLTSIGSKVAAPGLAVFLPKVRLIRNEIGEVLSRECVMGAVSFDLDKNKTLIENIWGGGFLVSAKTWLVNASASNGPDNLFKVNERFGNDFINVVAEQFTE